MLAATLALSLLAAAPTATAPRFVIDASGPSSSGCASLRAEGFPAIDVAAGVIVVPTVDRLQLQPSPGSMDLEWHDLATGAIRAREAVSVELGVDDPRACRRALRALRARVRSIHERLAAGAWQPLPRLPVGLLEGRSTALYRDRVPAADRKIQVAAIDGDVVVRIPGVRVLARAPLAPSMGSSVVAVHGARELGVAVIVAMSCAGDNCTCDPSYRAQVVRWAPEIFDAIDRAPCDPGEAGAMPCEPDLTFEAVGDPWWI